MRCECESLALAAADGTTASAGTGGKALPVPPRRQTQTSVKVVRRFSAPFFACTGRYAARRAPIGFFRRLLRCIYTIYSVCDCAADPCCARPALSGMLVKPTLRGAALMDRAENTHLRIKILLLAQKTRVLFAPTLHSIRAYSSQLLST